MRPQQFAPVLDLLQERLGIDTEGCLSAVAPASPSVSSYVPVIHGCDLMCTFCIIPFRRGRQVSRSVEDITHQVDLMTRRGMKEVTLLGQTVDAYGHDFEDPCDLSRLLHAVHSVEGLERLRFLTSHPIFMSQDIIQAVADLPKVCEHINLPFQAGDDDVLQTMRRRYTQRQYRQLVNDIRATVPDVAISTDVIVGFPGETHEQFMETYRLMEDTQFDKVHMAAYSPRPGTFRSPQTSRFRKPGREATPAQGSGDPPEGDSGEEEPPPCRYHSGSSGRRAEERAVEGSHKAG